MKPQLGLIRTSRIKNILYEIGLVGVVFTVAFVVMNLFQLAKHEIDPNISIWASHQATNILVSFAVAIGSIFFISQREILRYLKHEVREREEIEVFLEQSKNELERQVLDKATELVITNQSLQAEIIERKRAEEERERLVDQLQKSNFDLQALSARLLEVQEIERRSLALELHDELGQSLNSIKLSLDIISRLPEVEAKDQIILAQGLVKDLVQRVREISLDLRPTILDDMGLLPALIWHFKRYTQQSGIQVNFQHKHIEQRYSMAIETSIYRIVQESLNNVSKYAKVKTVNIDLWTSDTSINFQIMDQGVGFDSDAVFDSKKSSGISGMRERAHLLGGTLEIESSPGNGTTISVSIPFHLDE